VELGQRSATPLAAGDGVVFDAGEDRNEEQGARVWKIEGGRLLFHRAHSGLDFARIRPGQWLWKTSDPKLEGEIRRFWQNAKPPEKRHPLHLCAAGAPGQPLVLTVDAPAGGGVEVRSAVALQVAAKHPLTRETLFAQLGRLGGTRHELVSLKVQLDGPCHLPLSELNQLRRGLVAALDQAPATDPVPPAPRARLADLLPPAAPRPAPAEPALSVLCRSLEQLAAALECRVPVVYCDFEDPRRYREALAAVHGDADPPALFLATPRILKPGEGGYLKLIDHAGAEGVLIRNLGALQHYRERPAVRRVLDFSLNVANPLSARLLMEAARADWLTVSYDLNIAQALDLLRGAPPQWFELTLHQHMPLFHMEHCVFCAFLTKGKDFRDCGRPCEAHVVQLRDRVGQLHRLSADVGCRNTLFHGRAQTGARFLPALLAAGLRRFRIELLDETTAEARRLITVYQSLLRGEIPPDTLLRQVKAFEKLGVTEGTLA
jgi:putative protease